MKSPPAGKMQYRPEIDGLRAIAVISVILYHAQFLISGQGFLSGGYIGVDIFFVISGYLISKIILIEVMSKGKFDFKRFYERRTKRILPMLITVIFFSFPFAWFLLVPSALKEYAQSIISSLFFASNFFFYFNTVEYGAGSSLLKPFLHTWSLGVEEQFYIVFPLIVLALFRYRPKMVLPAIFLLFLISLNFSQLMVSKNSDLNFYLPFSRFWEMLSGSILAFVEIKFGLLRIKYISQIIKMLGLNLLLISIFAFSGTTPHPSFITILPVIGTCMIIATTSPDDLVDKFLASRLMVGIGLISYSLYLWHFPLFAFARIMTNDPGNLDKVIWIALTLILALLSYFLIEKPFRHGKLISDRLLYTFLAGFVALICIVAGLIQFNKGFEGRFKFDNSSINFEVDNQKLRDESWSPLRARQKSQPDFIGDKTAVLIIGNSHAKDTFNMFNQNTSRLPGFDFLVSNMVEFQIDQLHCLDEKNAAFHNIQRSFYTSSNWLDSDIIIVSTRYRSGRCFSKNTKIKVSDDFDGVEYLTKNAMRAGKRVIILGETPEFTSVSDQPPADIAYSDLIRENGKDIPEQSAIAFIKKVNTSLFTNQNGKRRRVTEKARAKALELGVPFYDKQDFVCNKSIGECLAFTPEKVKSFYDTHHYTLAGASYFGSRFIEAGLLELLSQ